MSNRSAQESLKCLTQFVQLVNKAEEICQAKNHIFKSYVFRESDAVWLLIRLDDICCKIQQKSSINFINELLWRWVSILNMPNYTQWGVQQDICRISFFLSGIQSGCTYLSACSNDGRAKCMWLSLWQWHETEKKTKWVSAPKKKKDKRREAKCTKTQRDTQQHKHRSKWLILCTTEFKR